MTPYGAFKAYVALKLHFTTSSYDIIKFDGKVKNNSVEAFETRKDKQYFTRLAKKKEPFNFLVANFAEGRADTWVGDLVLNEVHDTIYTKWKARQESLSETFRNDLPHLGPDLLGILKVENGEYPTLLKLYQTKRICIETLLILNDFVADGGFLPDWKDKITDQIAWPNLHLRFVKYRTFLEYDRRKFKQIFLEHITKSINSSLLQQE